jgi:hypothetical protein
MRKLLFQACCSRRSCLAGSLPYRTPVTFDGFGILQPRCTLTQHILQAERIDFIPRFEAGVRQ